MVIWEPKTKGLVAHDQLREELEVLSIKENSDAADMLVAQVNEKGKIN